VDVFGVFFGARQITFPRRESQKRRPEASGTKGKVKNASEAPFVPQNKPAVRKANSKAKDIPASRKS
jgi:hypothetical protein